VQDRTALREVYDRTAPKLFGVCLCISGNREAAEDILQDVYLKVWNRAGRFDATRASPVTWLCAIARNAAGANSNTDHYQARHCRKLNDLCGEWRRGMPGEECDYLARRRDDCLASARAAKDPTVAKVLQDLAEQYQRAIQADRSDRTRSVSED